MLGSCNAVTPSRRPHGLHTFADGYGRVLTPFTARYSLDDHIQVLVDLFECEQIDDAILVAHSYGGMVATGAMERIADRVRRLVYLDALIPRDGQSVMDLIDEDGRRALREAAATTHGGAYIPVVDGTLWGVAEPEDVAWVTSMVSPQPFKTYTDRVQSAHRAWRHPGMFIECSVPLQGTAAIPLEAARRRSVEDLSFDYRVIDACHDAMVTAPDALVDVLLENVDDRPDATVRTLCPEA